MKVREHFLLGTEMATISVTAKTDCDRTALFQHAVESILARYQEEFGADTCKAFLEYLAAAKRGPVDWRIRPEDSCWSRAEAVEDGR